MGSLTAGTKRVLRTVMPLALRRQAAIWLGRQSWLGNARHWWATELLRDLAERDPDAYHRFLWAHHLGYAESYEVARRFGAENVNETRRMLFTDLGGYYARQGRDLARDVASIFEVGCSMGYLLRYLETEICPGATVLEGIDIDRYAIRAGSDRLAALGSKVRIAAADMGELEALLGARRFDVILCAGVLMYLRQDAAAAVVRTMCAATEGVLVLTGLAHPERDNGDLAESDVRRRDGTFIHNFDAMVRQAGGRVTYRRWEGARLVDGNTIYFVFAEPAPHA